MPNGPKNDLSSWVANIWQQNNNNDAELEKTKKTRNTKR